MIYVIEISFSPKKTTSIESLLIELDEICERHNCLENYHICENIEQKNNYESLIVYSCKFELVENNIKNIKNFKNFIKTIKLNKNLHIDLIMEDTIKCNITYVSPYYLKSKMYKEKKYYIENQRKRAYSETDFIIMKEFIKELSKYNNELIEKNKPYFHISYDEYLKRVK